MTTYFAPFVAQIPPTPVRSSFKDILLRIKDQLVRWIEGLDASHVLITCRDNVPYYSGDHDIVLRVLGETPENEIINSAGRLDNRRWRRLRVIMRSRLVVDQVDMDVNRLCDEDIGHIVFEDAVCDALEEFFTQDDIQNTLQATNLKVRQLSDPEQDPKHPEWVKSSFMVDIEYCRDLTQMY
jgi:hypothetical protein